MSEINVQEMIDDLVQKAQGALEKFLDYDQQTIDNITKEMAIAGLAHHMELAKMAVDETHRGIYEDKVIKNMFATEYVYHSIKYDKTVGVIEENDNEGYIEVAEPVGVIAGVTPVTNPTSTTLFKAIIAIKTRNPIIFAFHPSAQKCSVMAAKIVRDAAIRAGAPENCIQWIEYPSIDATRLLMNHKGVSLVLATGGSSMVRSAYTTGKPALGVGPGNVPCYIEKSAKLETAVTDVILSKSFDNGMICASEQGVIVDKDIYLEFERLMREKGCYFVSRDEEKLLNDYMIDPKGGINSNVVGQSAYSIAKGAGFDVPSDTKILIVYLEGVGPDYPLSIEKLSPVLSYYIVDGKDEGIKIAEEMVEYGGLGHSSVIHSNNQEIIDEYTNRLKTGRIIVNSPSSHGAIGDIYNTNMPSLTLGCGSYGGNSTTANVTAVNLVNKKRVAKRRVNMQWFKVPEKIFFESGSIQYLEVMPNITRALIVADESMVKMGYVDKVLYYLRKRRDYVHSEIFSDVEPDPSFDTIKRGVEIMNEFRPDVIIALGGGSVIDATKGMWLFYEHPDVEFGGLALKFMDIRKRAYKFPKLNKVKMVAIPTTSGTGSEVTSFAVITDKERGTKYPLADYELTPDVAIVDPDFVMSLPATLTANTGMDVLTHAIESYVSNMASDYTDGLAIKAIKMVFEYLPRAYRDGANDRVAREKMHNASTIAGMAFTNAFLGVNHSIAHKLGGEFHISHGLANAIMLPYVIDYNSKMPTKFVSFPKYEYFIADEKYAEISKELGFKISSKEEGIELLIEAIRNLMREMNMPMSIRECGIDEKEYKKKVPELAEKSFEDQCTSANPRLPLIKEIEELYLKAY